MTDVDSVFLLKGEGEMVMTALCFRALGDTLARAGCPIKNSVLITDGWVMDYDGDSTDAVLSLTFSTNKAEKVVAGIPARTTPASVSGPSLTAGQQTRTQ